MADDTNNRGGHDRARVAGEEPYEVRYFASKHGISQEEAQSLIDKHGNTREVLDRAAEQSRKR